MEDKEKLFLKHSHEYFQGEISIMELIEILKKLTTLKADSIKFLKNERLMLIANHPSADHTLTIPATHISDLKGGNSRNFPSFWFPLIRQALLKEAFGDNRFVTIAHDIGWNIAMQELWHFPITHIPGGRCNYIISSLKRDPDCSIVIFPEGKSSNNITNFHSGFIHIASALGINNLVTGSFTQELSLNTINELKIINMDDISNLLALTKELINDKFRIS